MIISDVTVVVAGAHSGVEEPQAPEKMSIWDLSYALETHLQSVVHCYFNRKTIQIQLKAKVRSRIFQPSCHS